jgi:hypothetical protein
MPLIRARLLSDPNDLMKVLQTIISAIGIVQFAARVLLSWKQSGAIKNVLMFMSVGITLNT